MEIERLVASKQRRGKAVALALCDEGAAGGASGGGSDSVNNERAVLAGCPGGLGASVEALALLVGLEVIPLVCDEAEDLLCGVRPPGELGEACGEKGVAAGSCGNVVARCVGGVADSALLAASAASSRWLLALAALAAAASAVAASAAICALFRAAIVPLPFFLRLSVVAMREERERERPLVVMAVIA